MHVSINYLLSVWVTLVTDTCTYNSIVTTDYQELCNLQTLIHMYWILAYQVYPVWDWLRTLPYPTFGYYTNHVRTCDTKNTICTCYSVCWLCLHVVKLLRVVLSSVARLPKASLSTSTCACGVCQFQQDCAMFAFWANFIFSFIHQASKAITFHNVMNFKLLGLHIKVHVPFQSENK